MVALHPGDGAIQRLQQGDHPRFELAGYRFGVVNQIAQDDQLSRLPALAQLGDALQIRPFAVAGDGNAMGLQMIRFTQVHIGDEQQPLLLHPSSLLGQKRQGVPVPLEAADAHPSLLPVCKPIMRETNTTRNSWLT